MQAGLDPRKLLFIDETWAKTNMTRPRGRAPIGERLIEKVPHGHWKTTTLIAALNYQGIRCSMTLDGPVDGASFLQFVTDILVPKLEPGQIVVMDNLSSHKSEAVRQSIEAVGAELWFLPPYSPDLSPIEPAFSKIRWQYQSAGHRVLKEMWDDTQRMLDAISPSDAAGYFRHCGYSAATQF